MKLIRGLYNIRDTHHGCVATIGNFDGVHQGHQNIITTLNEQAEKRDLPSLLITFDPHPREFFSKGAAPARITRLREKLVLLDQYSMHRVLCLNFNTAFSSMSADEFIEDVLHKKLGVKYLIVGDDFHFGKERVGDFSLLKSAGEKYNFEVVGLPTITFNGERISSTKIREILQSGDIALANKFLGYKFSLSGRVAHGDKRGRTLGFPTANVFLHRRRTPIHGVFTVKVEGIGDSAVKGVANIGTRPTFDGSRSLLEIHLLNFDRDIYGKHIKVIFIERLRDEMKFESFDALKFQIRKDIQIAKEKLL